MARKSPRMAKTRLFSQPSSTSILASIGRLEKGRPRVGIVVASRAKYAARSPRAVATGTPREPPFEGVDRPGPPALQEAAPGKGRLGEGREDAPLPRAEDG